MLALVGCVDRFLNKITTVPRAACTCLGRQVTLFLVTVSYTALCRGIGLHKNMYIFTTDSKRGYVNRFFESALLSCGDHVDVRPPASTRGLCVLPCFPSACTRILHVRWRVCGRVLGWRRRLRISFQSFFLFYERCLFINF